MRASRGQASLEYVGLVALVAVVLSLGAALTSGGLGPRVVHALRLGLCALTGEACPAAPADRADLGPCLVRRAAHGQDASIEVAFMRLGGGLGVVREEFSDGRVALTFVDEAHGALGPGVGAGFSAGGSRRGAEASLDVAVNWTQGRTWRFGDGRAADAFLERHGGDQTIVGRTVNDVRRLCVLCTELGWGPARAPEADVRYDEVGGRGSLTAALGIGVADGAEAEWARSAALGWRRARAGGGSLYLDLGRDAAAELFVLGTGAAAAGRAAGTLEVEYDRRRRPVALRLRVAAQAGRARPDRAGALVPGLVRGVRATSRLVETEAELALGSSGPNLVRRLVGALRPDRVSGAPVELRAVLAFVRAHGTLTARTYDVEHSRAFFGGSVALGARGGAAVGATRSAGRLTGEWTLLPGLPWLPRADCLAA